MTNIILCGGSGTRLWPISRTLLPKQFVKLFDDKSLFQLTVERNSDFCNKTLVISNTEQYFMALDQLNQSGGNGDFLLEPVGRNTAPAIALACFSLNPDEIVLVTPSDHLIKNQSEYKKIADSARALATDNYLVTFGIKPTFAETGFGYIKSSHDMNVEAFIEKPDLETATKFLSEGNYFWNSGMFCFRAGVFLDELKKYSPHIYESAFMAYKNAIVSDGVTRISLDDMSAIADDSIDYAVMEHSKLLKVVAADIDWSDLGSFDALYEELEKDSDKNSSLLLDESSQTPIYIDSNNNLVITEKQVALVDIDDLIVVDTADALLISKKGSSQKVKSAVKEVSRTTELHNIHLTVYRPWGSYTVLLDTPKYKIKQIEVKPSGRLSLQKHYHRSEHWTVVSGTAIVTLGEREITLRANESIYIPMGELHRLQNDGKIPLVVIETQIGDYLGEDDIVRVSDDYQRVT